MNVCLPVTVLALVSVYGDHRPWMNIADPPEDRAKKLLVEMTTDEKLQLFHGSCGGYTGNVCGIDRLGIPQQKNNDGPQGFRGAKGTSTSWPAALTVAASFDTDLMKSYGEAMGDEFYRKGANIQLGPGVCLARVPRNGRNFEYLAGEDPFLGFQMSKAVITGIQSQGVVATVKHFVDNNQETARTSITENIDERTQFEMYYPPFEGAIAANVGSAMCSYNKICIDCPEDQVGNWSCENSDTLQRDFKDRLGFKGWVMSDWGATHSASINRGLDQEMPGSGFMGTTLAKMVQSGEVSMAKVNDSAFRILWPLFAVGAFDTPNNNTQENNVTSAAHNQLARKLSAESTVLLKNSGILPLDPASSKKILVIGQQAVNPTVHGGGSGQVFPYYTAAPLDSIRSRVGLTTNCSDGNFEEGIDYHNTHAQMVVKGVASVEDCCKHCGETPTCNAFTYRWGNCYMKSDASGRQGASDAVSGVCQKTVHYDSGDDAAEASKLATSADVIVIFVATSSSEGRDRGDLSLGQQDDLIKEVATVAGAKVVVVAVTPGAILTPWREDVAAIVTPMMPGQEFGNAIADILFGDVNPGGKLPITFPTRENEMGFSQQQWPGVHGISVYSEKLKVGYRWYDAEAVTPAYPFGHGLSYTNFEYNNLQINGRTVSCTVKNTGKLDGSEAVQLYLEFPSSAGEPPNQLKGLVKLSIKAGAIAHAEFNLDDRSFSIWNIQTHSWSIISGTFGVKIGSSSRDIRLTGETSIGDAEIIV